MLLLKSPKEMCYFISVLLSSHSNIFLDFQTPDIFSFRYEIEDVSWNILNFFAQPFLTCSHIHPSPLFLIQGNNTLLCSSLIIFYYLYLFLSF